MDMNLNIDVKIKLETPEGEAGPERTLVVTLNPFTVAKSKELAVKVLETAKDGTEKNLGKAKLAFGNLLSMGKGKG